MMAATGYDYNGLGESTNKSVMAKQKICVDRTKELLSEIEKFKKEKDELMTYCNSYVDKKTAEAKAEALREQLISVKDRLPEKCGSYLVYAPLSFPKNSCFMIAEFYDDNNMFYSESGCENALPDVTHWAYLPDYPPVQTKEQADGSLSGT